MSFVGVAAHSPYYYFFWFLTALLFVAFYSGTLRTPAGSSAVAVLLLGLYLIAEFSNTASLFLCILILAVVFWRQFSSARNIGGFKNQQGACARVAIITTATAYNISFWAHIASCFLFFSFVMGFAVSQSMPPYGLGMLAAALMDAGAALSSNSGQPSMSLLGRQGCQERLFDLFTPYQDISFNGSSRVLWFVGVGRSGLNSVVVFFLPLAFTFGLRLWLGCRVAITYRTLRRNSYLQ